MHAPLKPDFRIDSKQPVPPAAAQLVTSKSSPSRAGQQLAHQCGRALAPGCGPAIGHLRAREQSRSILSSCLSGKGDSPNIFGRKSAKTCTEGLEEKAQRESWPHGGRRHPAPQPVTSGTENYRLPWFELTGPQAACGADHAAAFGCKNSDPGTCH